MNSPMRFEGKRKILPRDVRVAILISTPIQNLLTVDLIRRMGEAVAAEGVVAAGVAAAEDVDRELV